MCGEVRRIEVELIFEGDGGGGAADRGGCDCVGAWIVCGGGGGSVDERRVGGDFFKFFEVGNADCFGRVGGGAADGVVREGKFAGNEGFGDAGFREPSVDRFEDGGVEARGVKFGVMVLGAEAVGGVD